MNDYIEEENELIFKLYEIKKDNNWVFSEERSIKWWQESATQIIEHITWFFEKKNSYYKHLELKKLPNEWLKCFSDPIKHILFWEDTWKDYLEFLLDDFLKRWLSPQSHNMARRNKYILIIYKRWEFFNLAHLSVKKWLTLEWENIEISDLLFSSDTLLRYIYISKKEGLSPFDMVIWEQTLSQTFMKYLSISEDFFNKDNYWELTIIWKLWDTSVSLNYTPTDLFQKYIDKEIKFLQDKGKLKINISWSDINIDKITIWKDTININKALEISFFEKLTINSAIKDSEKIISWSQLNLFSEKTSIKEWINSVNIWEHSIQKIFFNKNENCIYFSIPLWNWNIDNLNYIMEESFFEFICKSLFSKTAKKTIVFNVFENKPENFLTERFQDIYSRSSIYFINLSLDENILINEEIEKIRESIEKCDSEIMKRIYKIYILIFISFYIQSCSHIFAYFKILLDKAFKKFAELKSSTFSETENNIIEYKSWKALNFNKGWEKSSFNRLKNDISTKIKQINPWCILYWFDEENKVIDWINKNDFRKFNDDTIHKFENNLKEECNLDHIRIYKIPWTLNILFVYIFKIHN